MKYYDTTKHNFGYYVEDVFNLLPKAKVDYTTSHYIYTEGIFDELRLETEYSGEFEAPNYAGDNTCRFKFTVLMTTHVKKFGNVTVRQLWIEVA